ncbi:hypothetical protein [Bradyrhizobium sp.]|jgi:hypothetical protein|uniref:hypothetical protein n=1 Tax=Bradyrhizobium sp. TaxID=376 RepID=UPI003D0BD5B9
MKTVSWMRLDSAIMVTVWIMMLVIVGLSVKFKERGRFQVAGHSAEWKCYPQSYNRAQPVCFNVVATSHPIAADSTASLKLSGVSLALR